jgi:hypothetical protein
MWLAATALLTAGFMVTFVDAALRRISECRDAVARFRLTDFCLFTEANYTRNPSQADLSGAFQDHPFAFDHFPSGSLIAPPRTLTEHHEKLDRPAALSD